MMSSRRNSSLACYERLSPNKTSPRRSPIKRLTPHCVAGNLSIETCLGLSNFITARSPGASCNYAIGSDGRVGVGCLESNAAWTSSSSVNDNQAITFEISNSGGAPNWPMSSLAINSFIKIAIDICRFYGFKRVHYEDKPSNIVTKDQVEKWIKTWEKPDEMIITLHRWFSSTVCPGPYLISKLPDIVKKINSELSKVVNPYQIKIKADVLNARGGPGTCFPIISIFKNDHNIHTIIEESNIDGPRKWGKLKTGGWIFLEYTEIYKPEPPKPTPKPEPKFVPYMIKINADILRVRKGPGTNYPIAMTLKYDKNAYTIVDESTGLGANKWGKLKSGVGWISLDFVRKI